MGKPLYTMGIDVGSNFIKLVLMQYSDTARDHWTNKLKKSVNEIHTQVADEMIQAMLGKIKSEI